MGILEFAMDTFAAGVVIWTVATGLTALGRKAKASPAVDTCTDHIAGSIHCRALRNPYCSDGRCRYHCQLRCKCPEVV